MQARVSLVVRDGFALEMIMELRFQDMSAAHAVSEVAARVAAGVTTEFDAEILEVFGANLTQKLATNIKLGLTTEHDAEGVWDAAFYGGAL